VDRRSDFWVKAGIALGNNLGLFGIRFRIRGKQSGISIDPTLSESYTLQNLIVTILILF